MEKKFAEYDISETSLLIVLLYHHHFPATPL